MRFHKGPPVTTPADRDADGEAADADDLKAKTVPDGAKVGANGASGLQGGLARVAQSVEGALGVALVDIDGGLTLATAGGDELDLDVVAAGGFDVLRAKMRAMEQLGLDDRIEEILITLGEQYHLIRCLDGNRTLFLYLVVDRGRGNLGLARHRLKSLESEIDI